MGGGEGEKAALISGASSQFQHFQKSGVIVVQDSRQNCKKMQRKKSLPLASAKP
jgi:hypothetical protein